MRFLFKNIESRPQPPRERCPFQPTCPLLSSWGPGWLAALGRWGAGGAEPKSPRERLCCPQCCLLWGRVSLKVDGEVAASGTLATRVVGFLSELSGHGEGRPVLGELSLLLLHFSFPISLCHRDVLRGKNVSYLYLNINLPPCFGS